MRSLPVSLLLLALLPAAASAAAPFNDDFANAITIGPGKTLSVANVDSTWELGEPTPLDKTTAADCPKPGDAPRCSSSVWFKFVTPQNPTTVNYTVDTCDLGTDFDTVLGVYTGGDVTSLTQVDANDDAAAQPPCPGAGAGPPSRVTFGASPNVTYFIGLFGRNAGMGHAWLRLYAAASPPAAGAIDTQITRLDASFAGAGPSGPLDLNGTTSGLRRSPSWAFASSIGGASFECSLDGSPFGPCSSPVSAPVPAESTHSFRVRALKGAAVDDTPAEQVFRVDAEPPDTSVDGPDASNDASFLSYLLHSSDGGSLGRFTCALDSQPAVPACGNLATYTGLCQGLHSFSFAALDRAYRLDPSPATRSIEQTTGDGCGGPSLAAPTLERHDTYVLVNAKLDPDGYGGLLSLHYGSTADKPLSLPDTPIAPDATAAPTLRIPLLAPNASYHYELSLTTPGGFATTADLPFATTNTGTRAPAVNLATVTPTGPYSAQVKLTVNARNESPVPAAYLLLEDGGPVTARSVRLNGTALAASTDDQTLTFDVVDLDPGRIYHVRGVAQGAEMAQTPEAVFGTPMPGEQPPPPPVQEPVSAPAPQPEASFTLTRDHIGAPKTLSRRARRLQFNVIGVPGDTQLIANVTAKGLRASGRRAASSQGIAKVTIRFSKKVRRKLRDAEKIKRLRLTITAEPPLLKASTVVLSVKLKK